MEQQTQADGQRETPRETREQRKARELSDKLDNLNQLRGLDFDELVGYVYREILHGGRQSLPPLENIALDHEMGLMYGPGRYFVLYDVTMENGEHIKKSVKYNIGPEYAEMHRRFCLENGRPCFLDLQQAQRPQGMALADFFTEDKAKGLIALLGAVKMVLGGRNDEQSETLKYMLDQQTKTLNILLTNKAAAPSMPDALVSEAFRMLTKRQEPANPLADMRTQLDFMRDLQSIVNPGQAAPETEKEMGMVEKLIEKALEVLPAFLAQHNGNIEKAATAAKKQNPLVMSFLKNKDAQRGAYSGLVKKFGQSAADQWARSFGLDPSMLAAVEVTATNRAAPQAAAAGRNNGVTFL